MEIRMTLKKRKEIERFKKKDQYYLVERYKKKRKKT